MLCGRQRSSLTVTTSTVMRFALICLKSLGYDLGKENERLYIYLKNESKNDSENYTKQNKLVTVIKPYSPPYST